MKNKGASLCTSNSQCEGTANLSARLERTHIARELDLPWMNDFAVKIIIVVIQVKYSMWSCQSLKCKLR